MGIIPLYLVSKQINYLVYDEGKQELVAQYASGRTEMFRPFSKQSYTLLLQSDNLYDDFVKMTQQLQEVKSST
ncbi:MAG: hypothetical protein IKE34_13500 [Paenibacillus sp.]|nr:hypothetical protein [Paenibacillus sp.]